MFTTIEALRKSSAMQDRVTKVENFIKKRVPAYRPDMIFPIAIIADSNSGADFEWVGDHKATHSKKGYIGGVHCDLTKFQIDGYGGLSKAKRIEAVETAVNGLLGNPATAWKWTDGAWPTSAGSVTPVETAPAGLAVGAGSEKAWPFPTGNRPDSAPAATTQAAKPKKEKKVAAPKAAKTAKVEKIKKPVAAKKVKPAAPVWLSSEIPLTGNVSKGERTKQRKNVEKALLRLVASKLIDASALKTSKGIAFTIVL